MRRRALLIPLSFFAVAVLVYASMRSPLGWWLEEALVAPLTLTEAAFAAARDTAPSPARLSAREQQLAEQVADLRLQARQAEELQRENVRLRALLEAKQATPLRTIVADVIGRAATNAMETVTINRGRRDGVSPSSAVFTADGLVGSALRVHRGSADVLLITDPTSGVGAMCQRSRDVGAVKGLRGAELLLTYLPPDADVRRDDQVITSGKGGVFPKGIPIGTVVQARQDPEDLSWSALVRPLADVRRVEQVLVVVEERR